MEPATQAYCSIDVMMLDRMKNGTCDTGLLQYLGDTIGQDG